MRQQASVGFPQTRTAYDPGTDQVNLEGMIAGGDGGEGVGLMCSTEWLLWWNCMSGSQQRNSPIIACCAVSTACALLPTQKKVHTTNPSVLGCVSPVSRSWSCSHSCTLLYQEYVLRSTGSRRPNARRNSPKPNQTKSSPEFARTVS